MEEIYKEIMYKGEHIKVSNLGNVVWNDKLRVQHYDPYGYLAINIKYYNHWTTEKVHRLVAMAFIPNPNNLPEVNHLDYNRSNNNINNLEWVTHKENIEYSKCNIPDHHGQNNPNYGNHKLSNIYKVDKAYAKQKQGRPGLRNGRCRKLKLYYDNNLIEIFDYMELCINYLIENKITGCKTSSAVRGRIFDSMKNNRAYKKHYTFEYVE